MICRVFTRKPRPAVWQRIKPWFKDKQKGQRRLPFCVVCVCGLVFLSAAELYLAQDAELEVGEADKG